MSSEVEAQQQIPAKEQADSFGRIRTGMEVFDRLGHKVGRVDDLYGGAGDQQPAAPKVVPVVAPPQPATAAPIGGAIVASEPEPHVDALGSADDWPRELRARLLHDGFIRIDAGLLKHHRFALRGQIDRVDAERVTLNVVADDLIKR